ncbi:STAS domain-containing protein [Candidatus Methanoperedens nitratireducens]|uniref:Putative negative regulator of sigma-B n=1 Tax=Candidatus Methanoperedens nitratireducens TaxID=1392998 RepID=A0A284VRZ3_9EURY|nr:STAS domain-containing protein [Candidatus Methanoperedens nitroreducens]SNQ62042.1 putative negative regulator of sigma-B [Candidatus Methanoperedens nitroreducens]
MSEVTILKMGKNIIVPIQVELHDRAALRLQEDILKKIEETESTGLIIDVSAVSVVDSFLGRLLGETAKMARLIGAETVLVGMKKEVVITLIQLGMVIKDLHTSINIEDGMVLLEKLKSGRPSIKEQEV